MPHANKYDDDKTTDSVGEKTDEYLRERDNLADQAISELSEYGYCVSMKVDFVDVMQSILDFEKLGGMNKHSLIVAFHRILEDTPNMKDIFDRHIEKIALDAAVTELEGKS